jgi:hypothetical protein
VRRSPPLDAEVIEKPIYGVLKGFDSGALSLRERVG